MGKMKMAAFGLTCALVVAGAAGCSQGASTGATNAGNANGAGSASNAAANTAQQAAVDLASQRLADGDIATTTSYENAADGEHALVADGQTAEYSHFTVTKTGEADGDEADFYGSNAAVFATNKATLTLSDAIVETAGKHANGVFSYGEGTTVNISHSIIRTTGNCSGGLMTTGGGTMNATDVTAETTGNSSAAIRSDRGGGDVNVTGGYFTTAGTGSPVIYSTADISVEGAYLQSTSSQGVVVEGKNSVALKNCELIASNTSKNSDKSDVFQAVMIYQSMSGDASTGTSSFSMDGGTLTNANGDIFFVNNTSCEVTLSGATIVNNDASGNFLRAEAAGWGSTGSNGGKINMFAKSQVIDGNMLVDSVSALNLYLAEGSAFEGAINPDGQEGSVYVELDANSTWKLTGDSYVTALTCASGSIDLNGHKLFVNGVEYQAGSASTGDAVSIASEGGSSHGGGDAPGDKPDGNGGSGAGGSGAGGSEPPAKPE